MTLRIQSDCFDSFLMIGDRVLLKPKTPDERRKSGLYLPPNVEAKQKIQQAYVVKAGPGYPIPHMTDIEEPWKASHEEVKYIKLQAQQGDLAVYMVDAAHEIMFNDEKYYIVPHSAILMLIREDQI